MSTLTPTKTISARFSEAIRFKLSTTAAQKEEDRRRLEPKEERRGCPEQIQ
jgi:hypothetical protein